MHAKQPRPQSSKRAQPTETSYLQICTLFHSTAYRLVVSCHFFLFMFSLLSSRPSFLSMPFLRRNKNKCQPTHPPTYLDINRRKTQQYHILLHPPRPEKKIKETNKNNTKPRYCVTDKSKKNIPGYHKSWRMLTRKKKSRQQQQMLRFQFLDFMCTTSSCE